MMVIENRT